MDVVAMNRQITAAVVAGSTPIFRVVEERIHAAFPAKKSHLKVDEVLHLTRPFVSRYAHETESAQLEHGAYEMESGEHVPLSVALGREDHDAAILDRAKRAAVARASRRRARGDRGVPIRRVRSSDNGHSVSHR